MTKADRPPHTRIVATVGPACDDAKTLAKLAEGGVDVFRLNLSHGSLEGHLDTLTSIRAIERTLATPLAVLADLPGPKVRMTGSARDRLLPGESLRLLAERPSGGNQSSWIAIPTTAVLASLSPGHRVLLDDGQIRLIVTAVHGAEVECRVLNGGSLRPRIGVNVPDSDPDLQVVTETDLRYAKAMKEAGCDFIAVSFCRDGGDLRGLREALAATPGRMPRLVAKVERPSAVEHLSDIVEACDVVLVARGDLGVEMDLSSVPVIQKEIVAASIRGGKPVIVATQMLQSMIESPTPTRAEATDAANAVIDGADALMLSGETAIGRYPVLSVEMLRRIASRTERWLDAGPRPRPIDDRLEVSMNEDDPWLAGLVAGVDDVVRRLGAAAVVGWTTSGETARLISRGRLRVPLVMLTDDEVTARSMRMLAGVRPVLADADPGAGDAFIRIADEAIRNLELVESGAPVVFLHGSGRRESRPTDVLGVFEAGSGWGRS